MTKGEPRYTQEDLKEAERAVLSNARSLAIKFQELLKEKTWFKPIHAKRLVKGETEQSIKKKLDVLVSLNLAAAKQEGKGDMRYMITLDDNQRLIYLSEYRASLISELSDIDNKIEELENK